MFVDTVVGSELSENVGHVLAGYDNSMTFILRSSASSIP